VASGQSVRVGILGPLRLLIDGRVLGPSDFGGRKPKQVLEMLLVHQGDAVSKDRLADLLWGERLPRDPMRTLEAYVSGVRGRLHHDADRARTLLRSEPGAYRFALDDADVDTWRFDDLTSRAAEAPAGDRLRLRQEALDLVRGEVLADEPYADWLLALRDLYAERHLELLLDAAHDSLLAGQPTAALRFAEQVLHAQPLRERAHRLVMAARYALGDQDRALNAYTRCRQLLAEELGISPMPETERVYLAVLNQEPVEAALTPGVRAGVPPPLAGALPRTRFAQSGDAAIAYQVIGDGPLDVVLAPGWFSHVEVAWEEPRYAAFMKRLAGACRLMLFDKRGVGMSDPCPTSLTLDERADDIVAVMEAAGSEKAVIFGVSEGGPMGISLAARVPERVAGLVVYAGMACSQSSEDYPWAWSPEFYELYKASLEQVWLTGRGIEFAVPTATGDEAFMEWVARFMRLSVSLSTAKTVLDQCSTIDVRHQLQDVHAPTLVLHRRDEQWMQPENGRYVAAHIAGARYIELPGVDHWPWMGDSDSVLREVEAFLAELSTRG
jgi:DNA-binding SARP family transcriptional activator/pimeloyl-ACP methyl ester carboxylesterase